MKLRTVCLTLVAAFVLTAFTRGDDKTAAKEDAQAKEMSLIAQLGQGVHKVKTDDKGRIKSCVVVGQSRISTVLGKAKGLETARQRAALAARAEFVKWLKEKVSVHETTDDETILFLEGSEGNDKDALKESGKAVEKTSKKMESVAEGLVRGMQLLHTETSGNDKTYTLVYGWERKAAEATKKVREDLNDESKDGTRPKAGNTPPTGRKVAEGADKSSPGKKAPDKKIEDKKATSKDAKKFLDD
jgi:hypothetical protein